MMTGEPAQDFLTSLPQPDEQQYKLLLTVDEAARALSVGRSLIYTLIVRKQLFSVKVGAARRIPRKALEAYIEQLINMQKAG
jgi:excisionase family DNA binding protein